MATCGACQADNAEGAKFCSSCGTALARSCVACGSPVTGRFCSECGTPVDDSGREVPASSPATEPPPRLSERRITSVLFGDLVGFTTLSESMDPDDVRELLSRYFTVCRTIVERYGGTVEKFIGDAVMAVWGVPVAHEDDAERAVRAGLDVADAVGVLGEELDAGGLAMRVGVVTGEVAVNVGATGEGMVAGDAVNTASRVQTAATPGTVWVDDTTRELTAAAVGYEDRGAHELKGKAEPMRLFEARQVLAAVGGARRVDGLEAPFAGRDRELRLVKELFHATAEEGRPRLAAVFGAAGVGKSRLGWEFDKYLDGIDAVAMVHRGRCLSYGEGVAFWALAEVVRGRLGILEGDGDDVVLTRLRDGLATYVPDGEDQAWLLPRLATLLGIAELVAPEATFARDDLFTAWRTFLERVAHHADAVAAVLRIDDLQWADPGLLDFISFLLDTAQAPIFVFTLARSELAERFPGFGSGRRATALYLEPLQDQPMAALVDGLVHGLPDSLRDALVRRSEGIPLFAVETVRALIDRDAVIPVEGRYVLAPDAADRVDLDDRALPTSLHTLIASRLDALPPDERRMVQDAAVLGQSFTRDGLAAVRTAVGDDGAPEQPLASLVRKEIFAVESDPRSPERGQYRFVQAMVRTVAYDTLARRDRKLRHLAAARHLAGEPDAETIPAVLASHYLDAYAAAGQDPDADDITAHAVALLERAAVRARSLGAPAEARRHLETALGLPLDDATTARLKEAAARTALSAGATADAAALATGAREIFETLDADIDAARCLALWGETQILAGVGAPAIEPAAAAWERLQGRPEAAPVAAQLALVVARGYYLSVGDSLASIPWFDRAVVLAEALEDIPLLSSTLASYSGALVLVGRSRMGLGLLRVSLDLAKEIGDPIVQLKPLNNLISFLATRDLRAAHRYAEEGLALVRRLGDREWGAMLSSSATHAYWHLGEWDALLTLIDAIDEDDENWASTILSQSYAESVRNARGEASSIHAVAGLQSGMRTDVVLDAATALFDSFVARAAGDQERAAARSQAAITDFMSTSGIDDDFPIFWLTALDDQIAAGAVDAARATVEVVATAPPGHVPPLLRALLPWARARVAILAGDSDSVETDLVAAAAALADFGAPFHASRALLDHAEWLDAADRPGEAAALAARAQQGFAALGAAPWATRAARLTGAGADVVELAATRGGSAGT